MSVIARRHLGRDKAMSKLIERVGPVRLRARRLSPFQALCQSVIHQQLSGKAALTIRGRFVELVGGGRFPRPEEVLRAEQEVLRRVGMSAAKAACVREIAARAVAGSLPSLVQCDRMSDADLIANLTEIKGVGRWTAEMLLIFNLGRRDVLPVHDLGVRRGFSVAYRKRELPTPDELEEFGLRWSPHRSVAAWYLWRAADMLDGEGW